jgi:hypothetical protein
MLLIGFLSFCVIHGYPQKNIHYPTDTTISTNIVGYIKDTVIQYQSLIKKQTLKLIATNTNYEIVEFTVMWACPEPDFLTIEGNTITQSILKKFRGSNSELRIIRVLAQNRNGKRYWIRDRIYKLEAR